ncbi:MAG: hypothetical protein LAN70_13480 [Acidobacteriia bacterium]|nr:hypothetical protein [Terriglobia bacterium]
MNTDGAGDMLPRRRYMNAQTLLNYLLWIAPQALLAILVTRMVRNRIAAQTPVFFAYLLFSIAKFLLRFGLYHLMGGASFEYFCVYWSLALIDAMFVLLVIHEIYILGLGAYEGLTMFASILFKWSAALLVLVGAVAAASAPGSDLSRLAAGIVTLDRSATIVQLGLITLLFVATSSLWLVWQRQLFGIAAGMAVIISIEVVALALSTRYGIIFANTYGWVKSVAYLCGVLIWTIHFLRREVSVPFTVYGDDLRLQEWNTALTKLLSRRG